MRFAGRNERRLVTILRSFFLACSRNRWLKEQAPRYRCVRRAVSRFMPGETVEDALAAASRLRERSIETVFTYLGENVTDRTEAAAVTRHYLGVIDRVGACQLDTELSVKLTQLGLDIDPALSYENLTQIIVHAGQRMVWIDMEASPYVEATLDLYRRARQAHSNVGVCLQAYLYRTANDLESLLPMGAAIRLVKGAYREPADRAFPRKRDVDKNYWALARRLLSPEARRARVRAAMATHDRRLIARITDYVRAQGIDRQSLEFQMLYGIEAAHQIRLAQEGWKVRVLITYGSCWFPWYMRRLAERPANAWFVLRSLFSA